MRSGTRALLILPLALLAATNAKAADLYGKVVENELGGPPMAGVAIGAPGANPTATGSLGSFQLALPRRQPGETVSLTVSKEGYEVVNDVQLEVTLLMKPEDRPLTLLLCRPKVCEEMRRRFYRLKGIEAVETNYQRQLRELEQSKQATAAELTRLKEERDAALAAAEKAAEELARVRPADGSEMYQKALRLFVDGQLNEALAALDEAKLQSALAAARARKEESEREIGQVVQSYLLRGELLTLQFQFTSAEQAYQAAVASAPDNFEANFALAYFAHHQKHYAQATAAYQRCLELARVQSNDVNIARTLNNLGILLRHQNRLDEAREAYDGALTSYRRLAEKNPDAYLPALAMTLNNLGILLSGKNQLDEARKIFEEALASYRQLEKIPEIYLPDIATTLNNLGILLSSQNHLADAREIFEEALASYRQLAEKNPNIYLPYVAMTLNNLGTLLSNQNRIDEARNAYDEALVFYRQLAEKNPDVYLPDVAMVLNNLGNLLSGPNNRLAEARKACDEALAIRRKLAEKSPDVYLPYVAATLNNLGNLLRAHHHDEARKAYDEALTSFRHLAEKNPDVYLPDVAETLNHLGLLLSDQNYLDEAREAFSEAIEIIEPFASKYPEKFRDLADDIKKNLQSVEGSL